MAITASQVKELRERTGAGMMDCKKALTEANGDIEAAIKAMRKAGMAKAAKKSGRVAAEGIIIIKSDDNQKLAVILEINCETDFVGRDENLVLFANTIAENALKKKINGLDALMESPYDEGKGETVEQARHALVSKVGENIKVRRVRLINTDGSIAAYLHGIRIGVLVELDKENQELGKDIAMHIAASNPQAVNSDDVGEELINKEREIFSAQALASGKPPEIVEKMVEGRIKKFLGEVSLYGQPFVKDPSKTVSQLLKEHDNTVRSFVRFEVGEGIEKEESDFAREVMAQAQGES